MVMIMTAISNSTASLILDLRIHKYFCLFLRNIRNRITNIITRKNITVFAHLKYFVDNLVGFEAPRNSFDIFIDKPEGYHCVSEDIQVSSI